MEANLVTRKLSTQVAIVCFVTAITTWTLWEAASSDHTIDYRPQPKYMLPKLESINAINQELKHNYFSNYQSRKHLASTHENVKEQKKIVILMWTGYYYFEDKYYKDFLLSGRKWDSNCCPDSLVEITLNKSRLDEADALVFFYSWDNMRNTSNLPPIRWTKQLRVLMAKESPVYTGVPSMSPFNDMFNLTMTYRHDSDIWAAYGKAMQRTESIGERDIKMEGNVVLDDWIKNKTGLMTVVVTRCAVNSSRHVVQERLIKAGVPIEVYGACGTPVGCHYYGGDCDAFWKDLARKYKFYFAGENRLCSDYITEKFWRTLDLGIVPVVYGRGNYSRDAPPHSFIDYNDFPSTEELAKFLLHLDKSPEEYKKHLIWRAKYFVRLDDLWSGFCGLCKKMIDLRESGPPTPGSMMYPQLDEWWYSTPGGNGSKEDPACIKAPF